MERKFLEAIIHERRDHFGHDPVSPKFLTQPETEFGDMSMDVLADANTDPANRGSIDVDAKIDYWLRSCCVAQEFIRIVDRIWMREQIAQAKPDPAVVCMFRERPRIIGSPFTNGASLKSELHQSVLDKFDSRFLHFAIWQKPDQ